METPKVMQAKVSAKGWIVIPAALRQRFGLMPGTMVELWEEGDRIVIVPQMTEPVEKLYGKLASGSSLTEALLADRAEELAREEAKLRTG